MNREHLPIVALHGWGMNAAVFATLSERLDRPFLTLELPGHGQHQFEELAADPLEVAAHLLEWAPCEAIWLGWSLGGLLAAQAALMAPARIKALVIVSAAASFIRRPSWPKGIDPCQLDAIELVLRKNPQAALRRFIVLQSLGGRRSRLTRQRLESALHAGGRPSRETLERGLELLRTIDLSSTAQTLEMPIAVLAGQVDHLLAEDSARQWATRLPKGEFYLIKDAAHAPFLSHEDQFITILKDFLKRVDG